jgi:hypothetical protein
MDMPRCKTCKHWDPSGAKQAGWYGDWGRCFPLKYGTAGNSVALVDFDCDEGGRHTMVTDPEFGCVMHEERT